MGRILHTSTLMLVAFALLVPNALAQRPDDRGGLLGVGAISATTDAVRPDDRAATRGPGSFASAVELSMRPDDRAESRGPGAIGGSFETATRPDDLAGLRGPGAVPIEVVTTSADGFDWVDASVGAVGAFGLALILFAMLTIAARTRRSHAAV